jgi:DNA-binding transcriptional regulator YiaG
MDKNEVMLVVGARRAAKSGQGAEIREKAGLTRSELAVLADVSPLTIARWERGESAPRGRAAVRYMLELRRLSPAVEHPR